MPDLLHWDMVDTEKSGHGVATHRPELPYEQVFAEPRRPFGRVQTKTITGDRTAIPVAKVLNYRGDLALNHD